jgi:hypothetical protein
MQRCKDAKMPRGEVKVDCAFSLTGYRELIFMVLKENGV